MTAASPRQVVTATYLDRTVFLASRIHLARKAFRVLPLRNWRPLARSIVLQSHLGALLFAPQLAIQKNRSDSSKRNKTNVVHLDPPSLKDSIRKQPNYINNARFRARRSNSGQSKPAPDPAQPVGLHTGTGCDGYRTSPSQRIAERKGAAPYGAGAI
jgi:hypothetical protein